MGGDRVGGWVWDGGRYHIYSHWMGVNPSKVTVGKSVLCNSINILFFSIQNNHQNLDPSYKVDLDFWHCFKVGKAYLIANQRHTVGFSNSV